MTGTAVACSPSTPTTPPGQEQFCQLWDKVETAPPAVDNAVLVKPEVVAFAADTTRVGSSCTDADASVALDSAVLAQGDEVAKEQGTTNTDKVAAVTGDQIGAGEPVLDNVELRSLNASIDVNGISVSGNVAVTLSGTTSTIGFTGHVSNLQNWSISLSSSGLTIPGVTTSPVVFSGTRGRIRCSDTHHVGQRVDREGRRHHRHQCRGLVEGVAGNRRQRIGRRDAQDRSEHRIGNREHRLRQGGRPRLGQGRRQRPPDRHPGRR
ncbi:MAG: hypothetical protein R2698_06590 [Microthrixaceae bacterium]